MSDLIPTRDRIMALLSPPSQDVYLDVEDARWIKAEIERLEKDVDGLMELLRKEKVKLERREALAETNELDT